MNVNEEDESAPLLHDKENSDITLSWKTKAHLLPQVFAVSVACLGPLSLGLTLGFSSPTIDDLNMVLTTDEITWYASVITIGALAGGPLAGIMIGWLGRKCTIMMCNVAFSFGWFLIIYPTNASPHIFAYLLVGRLLTGIGMGMCSLAAPVYIAEISTKELRGTFGAAFQLAVALGIFIVFALRIPMSYLDLAIRRQWLAVCCECVPAVMIIAMLPLPETPRWLLTKSRRQEALAALRWLRGTDYDIEEECSEIEANVAVQQSLRLRPMELIIKPTMLRPLLISVALMLFQKGSGINSIIFYASEIFRRSGISDDKVDTYTVYFILAQVVATAVSVALMDIAGRRILLLIASAFMVISCGGLGLSYYLPSVHGTNSFEWLSLTSLIVFIVFYSLGWGPIPWLIMSEILPIRARGIASGIATCANWLCTFIITKEFEALVGALQPYGAFWFYGGISLMGIIFVGFFLPETKGKSLEQIEEHFDKRNVNTVVSEQQGIKNYS